MVLFEIHKSQMSQEHGWTKLCYGTCPLSSPSKPMLNFFFSLLNLYITPCFAFILTLSLMLSIRWSPTMIQASNWFEIAHRIIWRSLDSICYEGSGPVFSIVLWILFPLIIWRSLLMQLCSGSFLAACEHAPIAPILEVYSDKPTCHQSLHVITFTANVNVSSSSYIVSASQINQIITSTSIWSTMTSVLPDCLLTSLLLCYLTSQQLSTQLTNPRSSWNTFFSSMCSHFSGFSLHLWLLYQC